jgi:hypothetical protein
MNDMVNYFETNGYKQCKSNKENVVNIFQKKFLNDNDEIKYFITIEEFGFKASIYDSMPKEAKENYRFQYNIQFNTKNAGTMNIEMFSSGWDLEKVEAHVETIFNTGLFHTYDYCN